MIEVIEKLYPLAENSVGHQQIKFRSFTCETRGWKPGKSAHTVAATKRNGGSKKEAQEHKGLPFIADRKTAAAGKAQRS